MYKYVYVQVRSCTGTFMYMYVHVQVHSCTSTSMYSFVHVQVRSRIAQVRSCTGLFMCRYVHVHERPCMYIYGYVQVHISYKRNSAQFCCENPAGFREIPYVFHKFPYSAGNKKSTCVDTLGMTRKEDDIRIQEKCKTCLTI